MGDWRGILPFFLPFVVACVYLSLAVSSFIIFGESSRRLAQNKMQIKIRDTQRKGGDMSVSIGAVPTNVPQRKGCFDVYLLTVLKTMTNPPIRAFKIYTDV